MTARITLRLTEHKLLPFWNRISRGVGGAWHFRETLQQESTQAQISKRLECALALKGGRRLLHRVDYSDVLFTSNSRLRNRIIEACGWEHFKQQGHAELTDAEENGNELIRIPGGYGNYAFLRVIDATTHEPAVLRVPPFIGGVRAAIAWTFHTHEGHYNPLIET